MPSMKVAAVTLLLTLVPDVQARVTKRKLDFIRHMRNSEKINGPINMKKKDLNGFMQKSYSLKGAADENHERKLKYYQKVQEISSLKRDTEEEGMDMDMEDQQYYNMDMEDQQYYNNENNYNENYNGYNANANNVQQNANWWWWWNNKGNESAAEMYNEMYSDDNETAALGSLNDLSLRYAGCSSTTSFNTENGMGFIGNNLVQYRLCPANSCQDGSWRGCNSVYGEYMMDLRDYLDIQTEILEQDFEMLCDYCEMCYQFNENYCDEDNCCSHTDDCGEYDDICENPEEANEAMPDYEELFDCTQVDLDLSGRRRRLDEGNYNGGYYWEGSNYYGEAVTSGYLGVHCNGLNIEIGVFYDEYCTELMYDEETADIANMTGLDYSTADLVDFYVEDGCEACGGDEYNVRSQLNMELYFTFTYFG